MLNTHTTLLCIKQSTTMYEFATCMSTPANDEDVDNKQTAALALQALKADTSMRHHQTGVISSTTGAVRDRGDVDLSVTGHNDKYNPTSSTSSSSSPAAAAASLSKRSVGGNFDCSTVKEPLEYVGGLHVGGLFGGANSHFTETVFTDRFSGPVGAVGQMGVGVCLFACSNNRWLLNEIRPRLTSIFGTLSMHLDTI